MKEKQGEAESEAESEADQAKLTQIPPPYIWGRFSFRGVMLNFNSEASPKPSRYLGWDYELKFNFGRHGSPHEVEVGTI